MTVISTRRPHATVSTRHRLGALTGLGFVVCVLLGNSLTETGTATNALGHLADLATSGTARLGLGLELLGFVLLLCFVAQVGLRCRPGVGGLTAVVAGVVSLSVKLGSAAAVLGALRERDHLDETTATALVALNDAAFGLFMIGFGLFVAAAATALPVGRGWWWAGALLGTLTTVVGVVGSVVPAAAVPVPFLLSLLWSAGVSVRLAVRADSGGASTA